MKRDYSKKLAEFTDELKKIPEIIGIMYAGSTATETWDEYSDIDVDIVVKDKDYEKIVKMLPKLLALWGEVKFWNQYETWEETYGFIGDDYFKVELEPIRESYFNEPHFDLKNIKIIYDKTGKIAKAKKKSQKLKHVHLDEKYFRWNLLDTRSNFLYVANHYARGQKFEAASVADLMVVEIFKMLAKTKELEDWELRRIAEKNMTKKEFEFWTHSRPKSFEKRELRRALKVCWKFMKHVERQYEKVSGKKLDLGVKDTEIFEKVMELLK
jgi:predicted nucleotidyltransferase